MTRLLGIPVMTGAMLLAVGAVATAAVPKMRLTVAVSGDGSVASKPAGIHCPSACKLKVRRGARVVLKATAADGSTFSHWSGPCGTSPTCTVTMSKSKSAHAFFEAQTTTTTPPPPPPPAEAGHYAGTYTDGTFIRFDVQGTQTGNFVFDLNGSCSNGGTSAGTLDATGPFTIQSDGSFTGTSSYAITNGNVTVNIAGKFVPSGSATGTLNIGISFSDGITCTSTGTWTAQDQS